MANGKVRDFRYNAKRKNNPSAGNAAQGKIPKKEKIVYSYDPHLPPVLRFDQSGDADQLPELVEKATRQPLSAEEARILGDALRNHAPYLEWTGKREQKSFEVDPVALHIHERVSTQAILKVLQKEAVQRDLFADPKQAYSEAVQFYQHDVDWSNRLILGDSLQVMASLAKREDLSGKIQMIYIDPPYGISYRSNFQSEVGKRNVKDRNEDLTREPEVVKAYRDTWHLGIHSYATYLRDRLVAAKELLQDSGSIFVQISDENIHRVRNILDEVFGYANFVSLITVKKTGGMGEDLIDNVSDFLLWYARDKSKIKYRPLYLEKDTAEGVGERYSRVELASGEIRPISSDEINDNSLLPEGSNVFLGGPLTSQTPSESTTFPLEFQGKTMAVKKGGWKTNFAGMQRLIGAGRILKTRDFANFKIFISDFRAVSIGNLWADTMGTAEQNKVYVVQTTTKVIQRCMLMTTDPGDLVLDPTCGSGTTAYVAENWGRRWITIDSSRVAVAIARQRLLTSDFEYFQLRPVTSEDKLSNPNGSWLIDPCNQDGGPHTFSYRTIPHIMLRSIARNTELDAIFDKWQPILTAQLADLNDSLALVSEAVRSALRAKLREKEKRSGRRAVTDGDKRRWLLPEKEWKEWEVPFEADEDWPEQLQVTLAAYRQAWREKVDEVNVAIDACAESEEFVDKPDPVKNIVRVSGAFTVESVMPLEISLGAIQSLVEKTPIEQPMGELDTFESAEPISFDATHNAESYLDKMLRLIKADGIRFPDNKTAKFIRLDPTQGNEFLHAEGEWISAEAETRSVAVSFGPENGAISAYQVENALRLASRRGFDELVFAGFSFDAASQAAIQSDPNPNVRCHLAHIRPDVQMQGLLKETPNSQIFTVFGSPRTKLEKTADGYTVTMEGVDIYNPVKNEIIETGADKVAAWFVDSDYDGKTFCITQAFFPNKKAWDQLKAALRATIDESQFDLLTKTESLPFPAGENRCVAIKVIDPRGNEVMSLHKLD